MSSMKEQDNHFHARTTYRPTAVKDFLMLAGDLGTVRASGGASLNIHLPFEIQHPDAYPCLNRGAVFIRFGEIMKRIYHVPLYWENAPELVYGTWELAHGQTDWHWVPTDIDLTLDVGHLMIGASSIDEARERILTVLADRHDQIRHLHVHENDLLHDEHWAVGKIITKPFLARITTGVTFIFEKGESIDGPTPRTGIWQIE